MEQSKTCIRCKQTKSFSEFYKRTVSPDGKDRYCKVCQLEKQAQRYATNPEKYRQRSIDFRKNNLEKARAMGRKWKKANPEKNRVHSSTYQRNNPEVHARASAKYRANNQDKYRLWSQVRRNKIVENGVFEVKESELKKLYLSKCVACGSSENITLDHIIPIELKGTHSIGNFQALCLSCNSSKRDRFMLQWKMVLIKTNQMRKEDLFKTSNFRGLL